MVRATPSSHQVPGTPPSAPALAPSRRSAPRSAQAFCSVDSLDAFRIAEYLPSAPSTSHVPSHVATALHSESALPLVRLLPHALHNPSPTHALPSNSASWLQPFCKLQASVRPIPCALRYILRLTALLLSVARYSQVFSDPRHPLARIGIVSHSITITSSCAIHFVSQVISWRTGPLPSHTGHLKIQPWACELS